MKPKRGLKLTIKQITKDKVVFQSEPMEAETCKPGEHDYDPHDILHDRVKAGMHLEVKRCRFCGDEYERYVECEDCYQD